MKKEEKIPQFPCWMYHKEYGAKILEGLEEYNQLGEGWVDSPAKFDEVSEKEEREPEQVEEEPVKEAEPKKEKPKRTGLEFNLITEAQKAALKRAKKE